MNRDDILCRDEELAWLIQHERRNWRLVNGVLAAKGDPIALEGSYGGFPVSPPGQAGGAVTGGTAQVQWWSPAVYTPISAGTTAPRGFRLEAWGTVTSTAAGQTLTMQPAIGTAVAGQTLGASGALALGSTIAGAFWHLEGTITIQKPGTAASIYGMFEFKFGTTAGATTTLTTAVFGNTTATADLQTAANGLLISATPSAAGVSVTPTQIHWVDWN